MAKDSPRTDSAYQALKQAIIEQAIRPGTKLPEDLIGEQFGMSRTLVRAVLARLTAEGLVDSTSRKSAMVASPTMAEAREVFEVRRALESEVVRLIVKRWKPEYGVTLETLVRDEDAARQKKDDRLSIRLSGEFHARLAEMSGNSLLGRYLGEIVSRCSLILATFGRPHSSECAVDEHRELIAAFRSQDVARAVTAMTSHLDAVERRALIAHDDEEPAPLAEVLATYFANNNT